MWQIVLRHNLRGTHPLDLDRVGDPPDLPLGSEDPAILAWAEGRQRILVSLDKSTMPGHLQRHLATGAHSPGVFVVRPRTPLPLVLSFLVIAAYASVPDEWRDQIRYIP